MPTVENFTPDILWTTIWGFIALCLLFLIVFRAYDAIRTISLRRKERMEAREPDFAEKVSQKVMEKLEPRFRDIEGKLEKDKGRLDDHDKFIKDITKGQQDIHDGMVAICKFMLVMSSYGDFGNSEKIKEANTELTKYLAEHM